MPLKEKYHPLAATVAALSPVKMHDITRQVTAALERIADDNSLSALETYVGAVYTLGRLAAAAGVAPTGPTTHGLLRKGYLDYRAAQS